MERIELTEAGVTRRLGLLGRRTDAVSWDDLQEVRIRTTSAGPMAEDVFFVLEDRSGECVVPQGFAPAGFVERLQGLLASITRR